MDPKEVLTNVQRIQREGSDVRDLVLYISLSHLQNNSRVHEECLRVLADACDNSTFNCDRAGKSGAIGAVIESMKYHRNEADVQKQACRALASICNDHDENKRSAGQNGAIACVIDAMMNHKDMHYVQKHACRALTSICQDHDENKRSAGQNGAIDLIVFAMKRFLATHTLQASSITERADRNLQEYACQALSIICSGDGDDNCDNQGRATECGAVLAIGQAMQRHSGCVRLQEHGCVALFDLCTDCSANQRYARECGLTNTITDGLQRHSKSERMREYGLRVIKLMQPETGDTAAIKSVVDIAKVGPLLESKMTISLEDIVRCLSCVMTPANNAASSDASSVENKILRNQLRDMSQRVQELEGKVRELDL